MRSHLDLPTISDAEFIDRRGRAQALVQKAGLDMLVVNSNEADFANVRYFSDFWPLFEIAGVAIPPTGEAGVMVGPESDRFAADKGRLERVYKMLEYRESADPDYPGVKVDDFKQVFADLGVTNPKRIGVAGWLISTPPVLEGLKAAFPDATIERADNIMIELRSIKSPAELNCLRRAFEISEKAVEAVLAQIKPGMTELQAVGLAQQSFYANGAEYEAHPTYVLSGISSSHAISRPGHKVIEKGELVQLNIGARVAGYSPSVGLPICMGKMTTRMRELVEFGLEAHHKTIEWLQCGSPAKEVAIKYREFFEQRGFGENFVYGPCHGLGLIEVEPPWMEENSEYPLAENMTFQVDSFVMDKQFGLRWEHGACIKPGGPELMGDNWLKVIELDV
jgi:Xaa-Pro aminopeptidase